MRILQVSNGYPHRAYGGVELHTHGLSAALRQRGHEILVFTRQSDLGRVDGAVDDEVVDRVPVRSVVNDFKGGTFREHYRSPVVAREFGAYLAETKPDVVHVQHLIGLSADLPEIARASGARVVATVHEYWYVCARVMFQHRDGDTCPGPAHRSCIDCVLGDDAPEVGTLARFAGRARAALGAPACGPAANRERFRAMREALSVYERIVTPAEFVIEEFARQRMPLPPARTRAIALGIDRTPFPDPQSISDLPIRMERPLRLGFVGHALHHKGPHVLLEALARLPGRPITLELWGTRHAGHPYDEALSRRLDAEPRARHRGRFPDGGLPDVLSSFDVLVVPSTCFESFGIATREAFLAGRPVVTTDRGALPESVRAGEDGLLVPGDDPDALAAALSSLVDDPELLSTLARGALDSATKVKSMSAYAAEIESFLYEGGASPHRRA